VNISKTVADTDRVTTID